MNGDGRHLAELPDVLTPEDVRRFLGFRSRGDRLLRETLEPAGLRVVKIGSRLRILKRDLEAFLERCP